MEGNTAPPSVDESVDLHFVALVEQSGRCYSLTHHDPSLYLSGPAFL